MKEEVVRFIKDESGQGITEYGAILAFVAVLVGVVAGFTNGTLKTSISQCFSEITSSMTSMAKAGS